MLNINGNWPSNGDPFFNTRSNGGYSQCIQGKPVISGLNVLCNCVGAACAFFNRTYSEITGYKGMKYPALNCNAENFITRGQSYYGLKCVQEPVEGGIMVWQGIGSLAGHVAFVKKCVSNTQVQTVESGYNSFKLANYTRNKGSNGNYGLNSKYYKYLGCLVNPAVGEQRSYTVSSNQNTASSDISSKSVDELAKEVIAGKYGNGQDRKNALGSRYGEVQARVNQILAGNTPKPTPSQPSSDDLLILVKKTIRGDFGNGQARRNKLGSRYDEVQRQVNLNLQHGLTRWDNIKLF